MDPITKNRAEHVLERFVYEGILLHNRIQGKRRRIRLEDILQAGCQEPRILELLPALLRLRPGIVAHVVRDLNRYPDLKALIKNFDSESAPTPWCGIPIETLRFHENRLRQFWEYKHRKTKWKNINIRLSEKDLQRLNRLAQKAGHGNKSLFIRQWIEKMAK